MSDTFTVHPPGTDPASTGEKYPYIANEFEWAATQLNKGDRCWFRRRRTPFSTDPALGPWTAGTFTMSYFYEGIIARVYEDDPDDLIEHSLFLDLGDQISASRP